MPAAQKGALGIAFLLAILAVFVPGPSRQPGGDDSGTSGNVLLQLEGRFDDDEASFMQVSDAVKRRSLQEQKAQVTGAAASQAVKESHAEAPRAATPHARKGDFSALQLGTKTQVMMSSFVEMGRNAASARDLSKTKLGDPMMAMTIIVFALCGVVLLLIFFKLYTDQDNDDMRVSMKRAGARYETSPQAYRPSPGDAYQRPINSPQQYQRPISSPQHHSQAEVRPQKDPYTYDARRDAPESSSPQLLQKLPPVISRPQYQAPSSAAGQYQAPSSAAGDAAGSNRSSPLTPSKLGSLGSELKGAIVPAKRKFVVKVPSLLEAFPPNSEISRKYSVRTNDDVQMLNLKVLRHKPNPHESPEVQIEEYMTLAMPPELDKDLVVCTFGRVAGNILSCEIYKSDHMSGSQLYGILQEELSMMSAVGSTKTFTMWLATEPAVKLLTIHVQGKLSERKMKILDGQNPTTEVAATVPTGANDTFYETECYPHSDVLLVVLALAGVDRIAANTGRM